jgi:hypothetical protein
MVEPGPETAVAEAAAPRPWRRRAARLVVIVGIALVASQLLGSGPSEQSLMFRLGQERASVRRIDASWTPVGEREPAGGVTLRFPDGAPELVRHRVSLPNGRYELAIEVTRAGFAGGSGQTTSSRRVTLEGAETLIPLDSR